MTASGGRPVGNPYPDVIRPALRAAKRFLRAPRVIVAEILAVAVAAVLGASLPQEGVASLAELEALRARGPLVTFLVDRFALDHVFRSTWFVALTLLASASLSIVVKEQVQRLRAQWSQRPTEGQFQRAPLRTEFERPARSALEAHGGRRVEIRTHGRLGLAGSPLFHVGLLLVVVAGALRALFAAEAAVDLFEGETLEPTASAWAAQWPGMLAGPIRLAAPVRLDTVRATRYDSDDLRELTVRVSIQRDSGLSEEEIAVNRELWVPGGRLYLGSDFGPTAMLEWQESGKPPVRRAIMLRSVEKGRYETASPGPGASRMYLRAEVDRAGNRPAAIEVRVTGPGGVPLLFSGFLRPGQEISVPGGATLTLHGVPFWARLRGSRDPAVWLAYTGFALALAGATIIFTVVKIDTCMTVTAAGEKERVVIALRAQRFAPLFQERFARLVREQGGVA